MFRGIKNIFIILLIGIIASGIPIYANNIDVNALIPNILFTRNVVIVTAEQNIISPDHVQIKLGFSPKSKTNYFNFFFDESNPFTIELSSNNEEISNLPLDELISSGNYGIMEFYNNNTQYITFEFEQEELNLPDGSYDLKIMPNIENKKIEITDCEFSINFNTEGTYIEAIPSVGNEEMALTLYFPDNEFNHLVPITRIVRANTYPLTTTVRNIEQGPYKDLGLPMGSPIPVGSSAGKVGDTAHIGLPKDISEFDQGSAKTTAAINSFVRSLTSLDDITTVQFSLTNRQLNDPFHGIDIDKPFSSPKNIEIHTAYVTDTGRFLLQPIPFDMFSNQINGDDIEAIFDAMKFKAIPEIYNTKRHPVVPGNIELLDYNINDSILTLIFNEDFIGPYIDNPDRHKIMVDGIIFTFMSLEDVDSIKIKIRPGSKNSDNKQFLNYDFTMPVYINPEKE